MEHDITKVEKPIVSRKNCLPIKQWDIKDRPREKLLLGRLPDMSDTELLSILIGSGTGDSSAMDIAREILHHYQGNLQDLCRRSAKELSRKFSGIGEVRAVNILAGIELGRRSQHCLPDTREPINTSEKAFELLRNDLSFYPYERFLALLLSQAGKLIRKVVISEGGIAATTVDAKKIFKFAIDEHCSGIILAHNHPSGNISPSPEDVSITRKLYEGARLLDIHIFDHLIVSGNQYFSFADQNILPHKGNK